MNETTFRTIEPKILYFGTPVALISSLNENGETNLAPMSSFWALGWTVVLGLLDETRTADNMRRHPECVVTFPHRKCGSRWRSSRKEKQFHFEPEKFDAAGLTPLASELVKPERARECPVHLEARVRAMHRMGRTKLDQLGGGVAAEVEVIRVHVASDLIIKEHYIDAEKWSPLIYNFRHYYRLADNELGKTFRAEA